MSAENELVTSEKRMDTSLRPNFDYMFKIVLVGDAGVGKTAFLSRYCDSVFVSNSVSTIGIDFRVVNLERKGKNIKLQIWDTAGQERYHSMTTSYYRGANGFILLFDLTSEKSFANCTRWFNDIASNCQDEDYTVVLAGNKLDLYDYRTVSQSEARTMADCRQVKYFECSTKENRNVTETIECALDAIIKNMGISFDSTQVEGNYANRKSNCSISC